MKQLRFERIECAVPNMLMWRAQRGNFSFIVSRDDSCGGAIAASVKGVGAFPFDGGRHDLGEFGTIGDAMRACENWRPQ